MASSRRIAVGAMIFLCFAVGAGQSQRRPSPPPFELHVKQIQMVQTDDYIKASAPCQQARQSQFGWTHYRDVVPSTLEPDLASLMERSDEVVLAGQPLHEISAVSPSGEDVALYRDVKVLRTWKGSHKVGDTLTFAFPWAHVKCGPGTNGSKETSFTTITAAQGGARGGLTSLGYGPYVLFLRRTQGDEKQFLMGFQLTGGSGLQGMFEIPLSVYDRSKEEKNCNGALDGAVEMCRTYLESSPLPLRMPYALDPLYKEYNGMPIEDFLKEVQTVANQLGYNNTP